MSDQKPVFVQKEVSEKSRKHFKYRGNKCLNCTQPLDLSDVFCPYCSQLNSTKQLSLKDFFGEFLNSIVSYDSRLRYTVKDLLFKPGTITRNYANGQRLKYANPFRFFLSVSIIYFLLSGLTNTFYKEKTFDSKKQINFSSDNNGAFKYSLEGIEEGKALVDSLQQVIDSIKTQIDVPVPIEGDSTMIDSLTTTPIHPKKTAFKEYISETSLDTMSFINSSVRRMQLYIEFYDKTEIENPSRALDSLQHNKTWYNKWLYEKNDAAHRIKKEPEAFGYYLLQKIPFFLFFFTPFFALFFWLIYSKKKHNYMEHMVFIFHIFSFLFLGLLICFIPDLLIGNEILSSILIVLIGPFYFYKALRNFYKQNRFITILKFVFLNSIFWVNASIAALLFVAISAAIY